MLIRLACPQSYCPLKMISEKYKNTQNILMFKLLNVLNKSFTKTIYIFDSEKSTQIENNHDYVA